MHLLHWILTGNHFLYLVGGYIGFFVVNIVLGIIFNRYAKLLETPVGKAIRITFAFFVRKIVFLFTERFYRMSLLKQFKNDIHLAYKAKLDDMGHQIYLLEDDRCKLRRERSAEENTNDVYWTGVKYGYSLAEKVRNKAAVHSMQPMNTTVRLNDSQLFTLQQIATGNKSITGLVVAYLEDNGYVKLVWDNQAANKYHYEMTDIGNTYLGKVSRRVKTITG